MDMFLEKDYYTIEEALLRIKSIIVNFDENDQRYYGENEKLKFSLYVGSRPAYAAEYDFQTKQVFFIGHCNVHGIFSLQKTDLRGIFDNDKHLIQSLSGYPYADYLEISHWSTDIPEDARKAKLGYENVWMPREYTPELKHTIQFFYFRPKLMVQMKEGTPGAMLHVNAVPENILATTIKFDLGKLIQWPESQIFCKNDLRITHANLKSFIDFLKQAKSSASIKALSPPQSTEFEKEHSKAKNLENNAPENKNSKKRASKKMPELFNLAKHEANNNRQFTAFSTLMKEYELKEKPKNINKLNEDLYNIFETIEENYPYNMYIMPTKKGHNFHFSYSRGGNVEIDAIALTSLQKYFTAAKEELALPT